MDVKEFCAKTGLKQCTVSFYCNHEGMPFDKKGRSITLDITIIRAWATEKNKFQLLKRIEGIEAEEVEAPEPDITVDEINELDRRYENFRGYLEGLLKKVK